MFTHLTDTWSAWLLELHRILKPKGILIASFMGEGMSEILANEPWDDSRIGMNVLGPGMSWEAGGPMVLHSPWWIEAHWGRAFDILSIRPTGLIGTGQGVGGHAQARREPHARGSRGHRAEGAARGDCARPQRQAAAEGVRGELNRARDHYAELARLRDYPTRAKNVLRRTLGRLKRGR